MSGIGTSVHLAIAPWAQEGRLSVQARDAGINVTMAVSPPVGRFRAGHAKVAGPYIICGIEKDRALRAGFDDALMLDWKGDLAESTGANIFLVIDGTLVTPSAGELSRRHHRRAVMGMARKRLGGRGAPGEARRSWPTPARYSSAARLPRSCRWARSMATTTSPAGTPAPLMADFQKLVRQPDCEGFGRSTHLAPPAASLAA